ncbi:MAG: hypothetical protein GX587_10785 [Bacteroidales bacterium]|nr:hypothetical protein [Bacteroidales bacterium]
MLPKRRFEISKNAVISWRLFIFVEYVDLIMLAVATEESIKTRTIPAIRQDSEAYWPNTKTNVKE